MLKFTNTLSGKVENFAPQGDEVLIYSCGPTVYDFAHIGNLRYFIFVDLLRRTLKYAGFPLKHVMNITDVDDKTIQGAQKDNVGLVEYTGYYIQAFKEDLANLNLEGPDIYANATNYIDEMVKLIQSLLEKGYAYKAKDGIYFDIGRFPEYGKLSKQKLQNVKPGARIAADAYEKESAADFVLWKFWKPEDGEVFWETALGKGRPGWHIECSAMALKLLGKTIDIHTGGQDLIFPHHENEIAQSEAATDEAFAKYWLHSGLLVVEGKKMSKSLGNYYTLRDLIEKKYKPEAFKLLCLMTHYRSPLDFTFNQLDAVSETVKNLKDFMWKLDRVSKEGDSNAKLDNLIDTTKDIFFTALYEDLQTPKALASLFDLITEVNKLLDKNELTTTDVENLYATIWDFDKILGFFSMLKEEKPPKEIEKKLAEREKARAKGNWQHADELRREIWEAGWQIEDTPFGPRLTKR